MKCYEIELLMMEYFDGTLKKDKLDIMKNHLTECEACRTEFISLEKAMLAVENLPLIEPMPDFTAKVMSKVKKISWQLTLKKYTSNFMWAAALFAFMIFTRNFFTDNLGGLANNPFVNSLMSSFVGDMGIKTSIFGGIGNFVTDIPYYLGLILNRLMEYRGILLTQHLNLLVFLSIIFILSNIGLTRILSSKKSDIT